MLQKLRNDYLMRNGFIDEKYLCGKEAYEQLTPEEKECAIEFNGDQYEVKVPKKISDEEFSVLLKIQTANDISDIKKYAKIICGIVVSSFILGIIAAIYSAISITSML